MDLHQLGEFGLIDLLSRGQKQRKDTIVGIGDDCAVIEITNNKQQTTDNVQKTKLKSKTLLLITTDTLIQNVHFKLPRDSYYSIGQKAMIANISDISAMGGIPTHAVVTIGLPYNTKIANVKQLYKGLRSITNKAGIDIVGGDTIASPKALVVSITMLGTVEKEYLVLRSGARAGDLVCVTGQFGGEAAKKFRTQSIEHRTRNIVGREIAKRKIATAMIDSSDGLAASIRQICKASKVDARIDIKKVPIAKGATIKQALFGGEEYELVFTVPKAKAKHLFKGITVVGQIVKKGKGNLPKGGYDHFK